MKHQETTAPAEPIIEEASPPPTDQLMPALRDAYALGFRDAIERAAAECVTEAKNFTTHDCAARRLSKKILALVGDHNPKPKKCPTCDGYMGFGRTCPDCGSGPGKTPVQP
jgi:hypothetical protein